VALIDRLLTCPTAVTDRATVDRAFGTEDQGLALRLFSYILEWRRFFGAEA